MAVTSPVISLHFLRMSSQVRPDSFHSMSILSWSEHWLRVLPMGNPLSGSLPGALRLRADGVDSESHLTLLTLMLSSPSLSLSVTVAEERRF